jgi:hypothetical protein
MIDGEFNEVQDQHPQASLKRIPSSRATFDLASHVPERWNFKDASTTETLLSSKSPESQAAEASVPPAISTDVPLSSECLKIEPTDTVGTPVTSADAPPSPESPKVQP